MGLSNIMRRMTLRERPTAAGPSVVGCRATIARSSALSSPTDVRLSRIVDFGRRDSDTSGLRGARFRKLANKTEMKLRRGAAHVAGVVVD